MENWLEAVRGRSPSMNLASASSGGAMPLSCARWKRALWKAQSLRGLLILSRPHPATAHSCRRVSGRARAMKSATDMFVWRQDRSWR